MRVVTFKLDEELLRKLDLYCANNRLVRSEVIRDAIKFYLSNCIYPRGRVYRKNSISIGENHKNNVRVQEL
ncbi:ribbon-helix-helix protein, CopG family [Stygiolobus sp. CP850M]|jgi:metal-responsive CopG/Arc/MetJ family transcriptional regulator|uniref:ribbon-helix-helix protein, CopG family n=1 Tax=Stygiolobus sp. CP850M TaxID=3133134 RepID=UPI00307E6ED8